MEIWNPDTGEMEEVEEVSKPALWVKPSSPPKPKPFKPVPLVKKPTNVTSRFAIGDDRQDQRVKGGKNAGGAKAAAGMTDEAKQERARKAAAGRWKK